MSNSYFQRHYLDAIVEIYTTGSLHNRFNNPAAGELSNCEQILVKNYVLNKDAEILNLGCGTGRETFALYQMGYCHVTGVDCTQSLLEIAQNRARSKGLNIEFKIAFAHDLPFSNNTFDMVTMFGNLYGHITPHSARLRSLAEVRRVLKPGGLIFVNVNSILDSWLAFVFIRAAEILHMCYNPHEMEPGDKAIRGARVSRRNKSAPLARSHWFRPCEVPKDAEAAGLNVVQATTIKGLLSNPKGNCDRVYKQSWLIYVLQKPI